MILDPRFKSLIESSFDVIALYDAEFKIVYLSPSFYRLTGFSIEERTSSKSLTFAHPDDVDKSVNLMAEVRNKPGIPIPFQNRLLHKKGHYIWVEGVLTNHLDDEGIQAIVANYRDVTERKASEEKVRISEKRFRSIIEEFPFPVVTYDKDGNYLMTNRAWEEMWEDKRETVDNYNIRKDHQLIASGLSLYVEKAFGGEPASSPPYLYDPTLIGKKGRKRWIQMVLYPLKNDNNDVAEVILVLLDLTTVKEAEQRVMASEQRFRSVLENSFEAITLLDKQGQVIYASPSAAKNQSTVRIDSAMNIVEFKDILTRAIDNHGVPIPFEIKQPEDNGSEVWIEGVITNLLSDRYVNAIVSNYRDITERKHQEKEILKLNSDLEERVALRTAELREANIQLEAFSFSVSHDLKAPLRSIHLFSALLYENYKEVLGDKGIELLNKIEQKTKRVEQLIEDLISFSRVGKGNLKKERVSMDLLVRQSVEDLKESGLAMPSQLKIHPLGSVYGDGNLIKQIWINLLSNAIKYSGGRESAMIEVGNTTENDTVIYYVKDNGVGFDMQYSDKLFKVFQRLHNHAEFSGSGLGLAIVERIISRHGGKIWANATKDVGATFYFTLPG